MIVYGTRPRRTHGQRAQRDKVRSPLRVRPWARALIDRCRKKSLLIRVVSKTNNFHFCNLSVFSNLYEATLDHVFDSMELSKQNIASNSLIESFGIHSYR
ncbi:hypothetical protein TNCV_1140601 [Trichonephila clavipes]|nr:hypothetical protein TNCV_1140601 [Trichonephila clavipes]